MESYFQDIAVYKERGNSLDFRKFSLGKTKELVQPRFERSYGKETRTWVDLTFVIRRNHTEQKKEREKPVLL